MVEAKPGSESPTSVDFSPLTEKELIDLFNRAVASNDKEAAKEAYSKLCDLQINALGYIPQAILDWLG
jgi:SET domain-containing protein